MIQAVSSEMQAIYNIDTHTDWSTEACNITMPLLLYQLLPVDLDRRNFVQNYTNMN